MPRGCLLVYPFVQIQPIKGFSLYPNGNLGEEWSDFFMGALQYPQDIMSKFQEGINQAINGVREEQRNAYSQMSIAVQFIEQTKVIEQTLAGTLSSRLNSNLERARGWSES